MISNMNGIIFLTEHYFFLKSSSLTPNESKMYRRIKLERQARKAIIKFSNDDRHAVIDQFCQERNEVISWINVAISECSKWRNRNKVQKSG